MKNLTIKIDDNLYNRLDALCTHHGHKAFLIREAIEKMVTVLEQDKKSCSQSVNPPDGLSLCDHQWDYRKEASKPINPADGEGL